MLEDYSYIPNIRSILCLKHNVEAFQHDRKVLPGAKAGGGEPARAA